MAEIEQDVAAFKGCDINQLLTDSKCISGHCVSGAEWDAVDIAVRVANLAALAASEGGEDYTGDLTRLLTDARSWMALNCGTRKQVDLWMDIINAMAHGAPEPVDLDTFLASVSCYRCLGYETRKNLLLYLKCRINSLTWPD